MSVTIKTNKQSRDFLYWNQIPAKVLADQFDHLKEDENFDGFIKYRGNYYHETDFMRAHEAFKGWDGYLSDSYFSGIVLRIAQDGESYKIGTYYS